MVDRAAFVQNLQKALDDVTEIVTNIKTLVSSLPAVISTEEMDNFMSFGTQLDDRCIGLVDTVSDAVWDFADENDDIDLHKYE